MIYISEHQVVGNLNTTDKLVLAGYMKFVRALEDADDLAEAELLFVAEGTAQLTSGEDKLHYEKGSLIHLGELDRESYEVSVGVDTVLYVLPKGSFTELTNRPDFVEAWLNTIWSRADNVA